MAEDTGAGTGGEGRDREGLDEIVGRRLPPEHPDQWQSSNEEPEQDEDAAVP